MNARRTIVGAISFALLAVAACSEFVPRKLDALYLVPEGFSGWICIDFDIKGAPPLPREGSLIVIRPRSDRGIIQTSEPELPITAHLEARIEAGSERRNLPEGVEMRSYQGRSGPNEPTTRGCHFVGTIDQQDRAGDAPGFENSFTDRRALPQAERNALIAFYESTNGKQWKHNVGWLGPPGTECGWHGVGCNRSFKGATTTVTRLNLVDNNLAGPFPESLGALEHLESLDLLQNEVTGRLPDPLVRRWLSGELKMIGERASWFTDVTEIRLDVTPFSTCGEFHVVLRSEGTATQFSSRCRQRLTDVLPGCEIKDGSIYGAEFAKLAHVIQRSGLDALRDEYEYSVDHGTFEIVTVTRSGKTKRVSDYASAGPLELWAIRQAIKGAAQDLSWEKTSQRPVCPAVAP